MSSGPTNEIPVLDYTTFDDHRERLAALDNFFRTSYGVRPDFFVCVPGRVNLIGEHIDYNGYPVLPMAIRQNILLAVRSAAAADADDTQLLVRNIDTHFEDYSGDVNEFKIVLPRTGKPSWYNYVLCGIKGIRDEAPQPVAMRGLRIAVAGNIPAAAGLSSSSALVCAATLATSYASSSQRGAPLDAAQLAALAARCERYIGTEGGGMDQAIALLAQRGSAMFIDWAPLRGSVVALPPGIVFVIANSMAQANKADKGSEFNQRVVECRLACAIVAKQQGVADWRQQRQFARLEQRLGCSRAEFAALVGATFRNQSTPYSRAEILGLLGIGDAELCAEFLTENTRDMQLFSLHRRALHVVAERDRVYAFREAAEAHDIDRMGGLIQASHQSLSTKYDCSHACLDRMVEVGATRGFASRLTGAGWGGCTVALCRSAEQSVDYMQLMRQEYYDYRPDFDEATQNEQMFATSPQGGAVIIVNNGD